MYSINSIPLDNSVLGWSLRAPSKPLSAIVKRKQTLRGRRDGIVPLPSDFDAISVTLVVSTPRAHIGALYALMATPTLLMSITGDPSRDVLVELASASPEGYGDADQIIDATFVLDVPLAFWRSGEVTTEASPLSSASTQVACLAAGGGLSAPVGDAIVRTKGAITSLRVADSGGSWFTFPSVPANQWLRFEAATGRAFLTTSDVWTGGTEVSGDVDFGGPRGTFEITPFFPNPIDPTVREGRLMVTTAARTGASVQVRARAAHLV